MPVARALFRAMIPTWSRQGLSGRAMVSQASKLGIPTYRRTVMFRDIKYGRRAVQGISAIAKHPLRRRVAVEAMAQIPLRRVRKYRVFGRYQIQNLETGEIDTKWKSFYDDRLMSPQGWSNRFCRMMNSGPAADYVMFLGGAVELVEHNEGYPY